MRSRITFLRSQVSSLLREFLSFLIFFLISQFVLNDLNRINVGQGIIHLIS